jgi:DNA polymerase-3 subunit delta
MARTSKPTYGLADLRRDLKKLGPKPVYVVEGDQTLLADDAVQAIVEAALPKEARDFNLDLLAGDEEAGREFLGPARSFPFLAERRVVVLRRFEKIRWVERSEAEFLAYLADPVPSTVLVLVASKLDRRFSVAKELDRRAHFVGVGDQEKTSDEDLATWARERCASRGVTLSDAACRLLVDLAGPALLDIANEVQKLLARYPDVRRLEPQHVESTVSRHRMEKIWAINDALQPDDAVGFLRVFSRVLETEDVMGALPVLLKHVSLLLRVQFMVGRGASVGDMAGKFRRHPWQVEHKLVPQARRFTRRQLVLWQRNLQRADVQTKSLGLDDRWILERALLNSFLGQEMA